MAIKYSRQREEIKTYLCSCKNHLTADDVYAAMRGRFPNISLGTVYRNLTFLAGRGEITRLRVGDGSDRFDCDTSPHCHFVCTRCGSVTDFPGSPGTFRPSSPPPSFQGKIEGQVTYFYGSCAACLRRAPSGNHETEDSNSFRQNMQKGNSHE